MKAAADGVVPLDDPLLRRHLDRCLGCRACETACPSGVHYGRVLEDVRAAMPPGSALDQTLRNTVLDGLFGSPRLLDLAGGAMRLYNQAGVGRLARRIGAFQYLPPRVSEMEALMPPAQPLQHLPRLIEAVGTRTARVGLVTGCVMKQFFSGVNAATARVLAANGADVIVPAGQGCCGALHLHIGERTAAQRLARRLITAFPENLDAIIINAAGCGSTLKDYGHLLADDPRYAERAARFASRVCDIAEWLDRIGLTSPRYVVPGRVTYQDACHLRHAQGIREQPRRLLRAIPGLELIEMAGSADCCGSAGIYNLTQPDLAGRLLEQKIGHIERTGAAVLAVGNPGCAIQIASGARAHGLQIRVVHPVELLDEAYGGQ
jgi:glycolate oxidase iron-sulfur subunit